jgi:uncharacterized protein YecE (DUF72 family)
VAETLHLGIQGWDHPQWDERLYPGDIPRSAWLGLYAQRFSTVEVDDTFYGVPPEPLVCRWRDSVPPDFRFAVKAPQQITHEHRFAGGGGLLSRFLDRLSLLAEKLGPVLLLAPPAFEPTDATVATLGCFVNELPTGFKWALEVRHEAWLTDQLHDLLAARNVALVLGESRWLRRAVMAEWAKRPTADFAYVRWNSNSVTPRRSDATTGRDEPVTAVWPKTLERLAGLVTAVYGYFNVNAFGDGLRSAEELQFTFGQRWLEASVAGGTSEAPDRNPH